MRRKKAESIDHRERKCLSDSTPGDSINFFQYCQSGQITSLALPSFVHCELVNQSIHSICGDIPCSFLHNVPKPITGCSIPFLNGIVGQDDNDDIFSFRNELLYLLPLLLPRLDDGAVDRILLLLLLLNAETVNKEGDDRRRYEVVVVVRINVNMNLAIKLLSILNVATNTNT